MKYKKVTIVWWDAASKAEWTTEANLPVPSLITTTGYLVKKTKQTITICGSLADGYEPFGDCITIPKPWVRTSKK